MKHWIAVLFLTCAIEDQLASIRPGASYIIHSGDYDGIEWTDKNTTKPTKQEMDNALTNCQAISNQKAVLTEQAKQDAINAAKTDHERIDAITKYLGLQ